MSSHDACIFGAHSLAARFRCVSPIRTTRTRTQTTLTKLAEMVANVHGELAFLEALLDGTGSGAPGSMQGMAPEVQVRLAARRLKLVADRDALYATIRQFDAGIDPAGIGRADGWRGRFGRPCKPAAFQRRYIESIARAQFENNGNI